jgi:formate hydrogenlyase subunit 4
MGHPGSIVPPVLALFLAPLLGGIINKTKAFVAGRAGPPLLQPYYDLRRLLCKGAVYSRTTTVIFRAGPILSLAALILAVLIVPFGSVAAPLSFSGDIILFAYLLGLARFVTILSALDTGSSFEGMGASREAWYSALAEPVLFLGLAALARNMPPGGRLSLTGIHEGVASAAWPIVLTQPLVGVALLVVFLCENCRIPVDDPNTHLELTMIHEVMILDHSGPDLAFILYGACLKLWVLGALILGLAVPWRTGRVLLDFPLACIGMALLAVLVGVIESTMARLRLLRVPQLLVSAAAFSALALVLEFAGVGHELAR